MSAETVGDHAHACVGGIFAIRDVLLRVYRSESAIDCRGVTRLRLWGKEKTISHNAGLARKVELGEPGFGAGMATTFVTKATNARRIGMIGVRVNGCIVKL